MEADVSICSKPGGSRRARSVMAGSGAVGALMLTLLVGSSYSQADGEPKAPQLAKLSTPVPVTTPTVADASDGSPRAEQLAAKIAELDALLLDKQKLEDALRIEKSAQAAARLQLENSKKLIRMEVDDFLGQGADRKRLNELLDEHARTTEAEATVSGRVDAIEKDLGSQHLKFSLAARDVERLKAQLAAEIRERNSKKIQAIARKLDKTIRFEQSVSFRCSASKSLADCLAEHRNDGQMSQWVLENYQRVLAEDLKDQVADLALDTGWYRYRTRSDFAQASMSLDGTVNAQVSIEATVSAKKMMPCAILDVPYEQCDSKTYSLIVRSNKYGDQVRINDQEHGATPVSLVLDSGVYDIQVTSGGITQKRTLSLKGDQVLNFKF
ncbi:PEGA domain-containing protein [Stutzerimonas stutzeri]|uniref:PEGA domain-containing protein n=1 Tax=Stutzerimonas stutzeri TaxID=316 RepID=A0A2N8T3P6_STUST|nr:MULTISPECIES: PEGA domain-containing protein [Pseudomonadaceae]MCQ4323756.1 PEGA domain-containing protein [Stutzerimonas stutzeri]PNG09336.1 PEGA domain-containing protein [Stutzerimonas stutzeri]